MGVVIQYQFRPQYPDDEDEIDLLTAVDAAIRDLRDITRAWGTEAAREQAEECRMMLERAFDAAL